MKLREIRSDTDKSVYLAMLPILFTNLGRAQSGSRPKVGISGRSQSLSHIGGDLYYFPDFRGEEHTDIQSIYEEKSVFLPIVTYYHLFLKITEDAPNNCIGRVSRQMSNIFQNVYLH